MAVCGTARLLCAYANAPNTAAQVATINGAIKQCGSKMGGDTCGCSQIERRDLRAAQAKHAHTILSENRRKLRKKIKILPFKRWSAHRLNLWLLGHLFAIQLSSFVHSICHLRLPRP